MKTLHAVQQSGDNPSELKPDGPQLILSSLCLRALRHPNEASPVVRDDDRWRVLGDGCCGDFAAKLAAAAHCISGRSMDACSTSSRTAASQGRGHVLDIGRRIAFARRPEQAHLQSAGSVRNSWFKMQRTSSGSSHGTSCRESLRYLLDGDRSISFGKSAIRSDRPGHVATASAAASSAHRELPRDPFRPREQNGRST